MIWLKFEMIRDDNAQRLCSNAVLEELLSFHPEIRKCCNKLNPRTKRLTNSLTNEGGGHCSHVIFINMLWSI